MSDIRFEFTRGGFTFIYMTNYDGFWCGDFHPERLHLVLTSVCYQGEDLEDIEVEVIDVEFVRDLAVDEWELQCFGANLA